MQDYIIMSDNMGDLPDAYCKQHHLRRVFLTYMMDGVTYDENNRQGDKEFYERMRQGALPVTSQINPQRARDAFIDAMEESKNIIFIAVSSGISGTYSSVCAGAADVMAEYPDARITVIDSLCASLGEGLFIHKALMMKENGASYDEVVAWCEANKRHVVHSFTVDDLFHLHRGGRVSRTSAILGSVIQIKPMLHVDDAGELKMVGKVRGRRKSIQALIDAMKNQAGSRMGENDIVFISHGDCLEDALTLKKMVEEQLGIKEVLINYVDSVIGCHTGCGVLTLFFMGDVR